MTELPGAALLHLGMDFVTSDPLVLVDEGAPDKAKEFAASLVFLDRLGAGERPEASEVDFHANATNVEVVRELWIRPVRIGRQGTIWVGLRRH